MVLGDRKSFDYLSRPLAESAYTHKPPFATQFRRGQKGEVGLPQALGALIDHGNKAQKRSVVLKLFFQNVGCSVTNVVNNWNDSIMLVLP